MAGTHYENLRDGWWDSYIAGIGDYQNHEVAAHKIISAFVSALGVPDSCWRYVNRDGTRAHGTSYSFSAATEPQEDGWTTTCFSITFEKNPQTYPKQDVTIRFWMRAAGDKWDVRLYEDDRAKRVEASGTTLEPLVTQFVDEMRVVLHSVTAWPPPSERKRQLGFHVDTVDRAGA